MLCRHIYLKGDWSDGSIGLFLAWTFWIVLTELVTPVLLVWFPWFLFILLILFSSLCLEVKYLTITTFLNGSGPFAPMYFALSVISFLCLWLFIITLSGPVLFVHLLLSLNADGTSTSTPIDVQIVVNIPMSSLFLSSLFLLPDSGRLKTINS